MNITVGDEKPYIQKFLTERKPTKGQAKKMFPSDQRELCLATAWRLVEEGQSVLVFCPERRSVLPYAKRIVDMHKRGHLASVLEQPAEVLKFALTVGSEWFGQDHVVLKCLKLGVAVHHGALPTPYRKEVERLLRDGVLKVTISSPTLAQGLNLSATSLVFHGLTRGTDPIDIAEFRNVVGRAGRAYIDIEGLVLCPMFDKQSWRRKQWAELVSSAKGREMESGLLRLLVTLLKRMQTKLKSGNLDQLVEYVLGQGAWESPVVTGESDETAAAGRAAWQTHLMSLDTAILSLLGEQDFDESQIEKKLDELLTSSLFKRRLARRSEPIQKVIGLGLTARAKAIWKETTPLQRKGYFLAGVGLETGQELDKRAPELEELLLRANVYVGSGESEMAVEAITAFAEIAFGIAPFAPRSLLDNWAALLRLWLLGQPLTEWLAGDSDDAITFIEQAFVYSLPWAMEAVRVRAAVHENVFSDDLKLSDYPHAHAVAALETGTLSIPATLLIQSGFASRLAAIRAVETTGADFDSMSGLDVWLKSDALLAASEDEAWPTVETRELWLDYVSNTSGPAGKAWAAKSYTSPVQWTGVPMPPGMPLRIGGGVGRERAVLRPDFQVAGTIPWTPNAGRSGVLIATATGAKDSVDLKYIGPEDLVND